MSKICGREFPMRRATRVLDCCIGVARTRCLVSGFALLAALLNASSVAHAQGIFLTGTGPINQSMGGAAVAAPLDSAGALNWNPATISGLNRSEMAIALGVVIPTTSLGSSIPGLGLSGITNGGPGVSPVPTMSFVLKNPDSAFTWGVGVYGIGGFSSNFASNALGPGANPVLTPQPGLGGVGAGRVFSQAQIYQIAPTVSYALTEKLSFGFAPTIDLANAQADPMFLAPPTGPGLYGPGTGSAFTWGGGFQLGVYYIINPSWRIGASYKSIQWFEPFHYQSNTLLGDPVFDRLRINLPSITSVGASFNGFERMVWAVDVRYFDYENASGFNGTGITSTGAVAGLGWRSVVGVSNGVQYSFTDRLSGRVGYTYIDNPIPSSQEAFNIGTSLIMKNFLSIGASYRMRHNLLANVAYTHGFQASLTGPYYPPIGNAGSITSSVSVDWIQAGLTLQF
jgi:long-chain fatty acid transport protein